MNTNQTHFQVERENILAEQIDLNHFLAMLQNFAYWDVDNLFT
jgi:hypothetical protein